MMNKNWLKDMGYVFVPKAKFYTTLPNRLILISITNPVDGVSYEMATYVGFYESSWDSKFLFSQVDEDDVEYFWTTSYDAVWNKVETSATKYMTKSFLKKGV